MTLETVSEYEIRPTGMGGDRVWLVSHDGTRIGTFSSLSEAESAVAFHKANRRAEKEPK